MFLYTSIELVSYFGKVQRGMALVKASLGYFTAPKAEGAEFSSPFGAKDRPESVLAPLTHGADGLASPVWNSRGVNFITFATCSSANGELFGSARWVIHDRSIKSCSNKHPNCRAHRSLPQSP
jgi:hypothetical protein